MTCFLCTQPISRRQRVEYHHPVYRSRGGKATAPCHRRCHRQHHQRQGDFIEWGRRSSQTMRWAFNLLNVRNHPAYDEHRRFYLMTYAQAGWSAGLVM